MFTAFFLRPYRLTIFIGAAFIGLQLPYGSAAAQADCRDQVEVSRGDTLAGVARRCGITLSTLLRANPQIENPNLVEPGMTVKLPNERVMQAESHGQVEVRDGDTLITIADDLEIPLAFLMAANPDVEPEDLEPGIVVALPAE